MDYSPGFGSGFGFGWSLFDSMFFIIPILMVGMIIFFIISAVKGARYNNSQPITPVEAKVLTKRTDVSGGGNDHRASTWYYVTFEFVNGERFELSIPDSQFGFLVEGDRGILTFQGNKYISFNRK